MSKKQAEIASTKNSFVKMDILILLAQAAETTVNGEITVLGDKAVAAIENLIAKL